MNKLIFALTALLSVSSAAAASGRESLLFDFGWEFSIDGGKAWKEVQLPHDWSMELPFLQPNTRPDLHRMGFMQGGIGLYKKEFDVPSSWKGKRVTLDFDGVYHRSTTYVNGKEAGFHAYGYTAFSYDITDLLVPGKKNFIEVKVDHSDFPSSRWYSGSGIYRHVKLTVTNPVHIAYRGTFLTTPEVSADMAKVRIVTDIENKAPHDSRVSLTSEVRSPSGALIARISSPVRISSEGRSGASQEVVIKAPELWDIDNPALYTVISILRSGGREIDRYETPFGIRDILFDPERGFFLNGRHVKMLGTNVHLDAGSLGTALPDREVEWRLEILKELGFNAIRCSHNPPSEVFLNLCDKLGFLVIDESFDKWKSGYYAGLFDSSWKEDIKSMVLRDRNHPCVVLWSVGNETEEQNDLSGEGTRRLSDIRDYVESLDPTRKVSVTVSPDYDRTFDKNGFNQAVEVVGYNYQEPFFDQDHEKWPGRIMYGSEVMPYYSVGKTRLREYIETNPWYAYADRDFIFGYFIWTAQDYIGESSGWPSKGWPTGIFDICMFEKPSAAFFRAAWNPDQPVVRLAVRDDSPDSDPGKDMWTWPGLTAHWTFPGKEGHMMEVQTITNCEEVELIVAGKSVGKRRTADFNNNTITWWTPYKPGVLKAIGYNDGNVASEDELRTSGPPVAIVLEADRTGLSADRQDISHITITLVDNDGVTVPNADRPVEVVVEGNGRFLAMDNGDLRDNGNWKRNDKPTRQGRARAIIQSTSTPGDILVTVYAEGLPPSHISLVSD